MYEEFYHFRQKPFQLTPDPAFLYKSEKHRKALSYLEYGLAENVNIIVLTGEVGSGKTTTARYILNQLADQLDPAMITNTNLSADQMLRMVHHAFGIPGEKMDKAAVIDAIHRHLLNRHESGRHALLVIDEAQNLDADVLEELRLLSNFQKDQFALLQIMLVGQPELLRTLRKPGMRQFSQRVAVHYHLTALSNGEIAGYIDYRVRTAGGDSGLFTPAAVDMIFAQSKGIPRSINLLCDAALVYGFVDAARNITQDVIRDIINDRLGVGIAPDESEPPADPIAAVFPEEAAGEDAALVPEAIENIRMEVKGRIRQLQTDLDEKENDLLNQVKTRLDDVHRQNESLAQKVATIDRRLLSLCRFFKKLAKKKNAASPMDAEAKRRKIHA
jgi:general secretion pathway protein A